MQAMRNRHEFFIEARHSRFTQIFSTQEDCMKTFKETLRELRWDDHRYYHQSRINQSLHLFSALSFLVAYGVMFFDPILATLIGWLIKPITNNVGLLNQYFWHVRSPKEILVCDIIVITYVWVSVVGLKVYKVQIPLAITNTHLRFIDAV